jgi:hypothetical protein
VMNCAFLGESCCIVDDRGNCDVRCKFFCS